MRLRYKNRLLLFSFCLLCINAPAQKGIYHEGWIDFNKNGKKDIFEDAGQPVDKRVEDLLSQMNVDEKTCQLATLYGYGRVLKDELPTPAWKTEIWKDGIGNMDEHLSSQRIKTDYSFPFSRHAEAINTVQRWFVEETRIGIPVDFSNEGIHGLTHEKATPLPAPIGIGSTWNKTLVRWAGQTVGREAKALGYTNVYVPILDPARDQRWGRVVETYGEDPFLIAELGKQMALGVQEKGVAATLKHFAVYSVPKGGRDGHARTDPHVAPREMHDLYLYPFRRVIAEAAPMGVMSSYNDYDGVPVTGSHYFLTELLRQQFGFDGYVVSDSEAVEYIFSKHRVAPDFKDAVRQAVEAGLNVWTNFKKPEVYINNVRELLKEGRLSPQVVDARVRDVLRVKFRLGLFDQPYVADTKAADKLVHTAADDSLELALNKQSLVLLKNEKNALPLDKKKLRRLLVTGPLAAETGYSVSRYGPSNNPLVSVLEGIKKAAGSNVVVDYAKGCAVVNEGWPDTELAHTPLTAAENTAMAEAVQKGREADAIVVVLGQSEKIVGESRSQTSLNLPGRQQDLLEAVAATGKPVVLVLINGQPLTINWADKNVPAILEAWFPSASGGTAIAQALFGEYNPGGRLPVTFPKTVGQIELNFPFKPGSHAGQPIGGNNGGGKTRVVGPLYPFGHGLSYTSFAYSNLAVSPTKGGEGSEFRVTVDVTNSGNRSGDEVVQLYLKDKVSSVITYEMVLRGFERITLAPGETKMVDFRLQPDDLKLYNRAMNWVVEPGTFEVLIGASSTDIRLRADFEVTAK